jgi:hypothetical protein
MWCATCIKDKIELGGSKISKMIHQIVDESYYFNNFNAHQFYKWKEKIF